MRGASWILNTLIGLMIVAAAGNPAAASLEKDEVTFGFIKLTDCAALVIAKEKGFFEEQGLYVTLQAQANWKVLMDRVISGELDGAHMLAAAPLGHTAGLLTKAHIIVPYIMSTNGAGITVSNEVWAKMKPHVPLKDGLPMHPISASALKPVVEEFKAEGKSFKMAMTYPIGTHNYVERYWLAGGGIHPGLYTATDTSGMTDADVQLSVTPPPQMAATLESGTIHGFCVGDPWNTQCAVKGIGVPVTSSYFINNGLPDKAFGMSKEWADGHPKTVNAIVKGLIRAGQWLDADVKNRDEAAKILSKPEYVGADYKVIRQMLTGTFEYEKGDQRSEPDWDLFARDNANYPYYSGAVWYLTQMRRWGQIPEPKTDHWYTDLAKQVYQPEIYLAAAQELVKEGHIPASSIPEAADGFKEPSSKFIDGIEFDGRHPNDYLNKFSIGNKN